ncbi:MULTISPECIES: hypothetical protein [Catenuloplanes]|uniref:Uncharacterized protein n=1 Tax=Catenuloplanes niger TaxID=587534 RepID=A0AAE3ZPN7_9ACTN|nr:hypothetical protein [Catenuloplanes niger]MDR7322644.1 hypothetical protein [Catenuloplanes niger]
MEQSSPGTTITLLIVGGLFTWYYVARQRKQREDEAELQALGPVRERVGTALALVARPWRISALENGQRDTWPLTADTIVTVEMEGEITTVRGRNLAAKAVGGAAVPVLGLFIFGNAKNRSVDNRELYITITSEDDARVLKVPPTLSQEARQFAAMVNVTAKQLAEKS